MKIRSDLLGKYASNIYRGESTTKAGDTHPRRDIVKQNIDKVR